MTKHQLNKEYIICINIIDTDHTGGQRMVGPRKQLRLSMSRLGGSHKTTLGNKDRVQSICKTNGASLLQTFYLFQPRTVHQIRSDHFHATESISFLADLYSSSFFTRESLFSINAGSSSSIALSCFFSLLPTCA